jgi:hypothetical protein
VVIGFAGHRGPTHPPANHGLHAGEYRTADGGGDGKMSGNEQRDDEARFTKQSIGAVIRSARRRRYWTQGRLAHQMQIVAHQMGWEVPKAKSLVVSISRWEREERCPDYYSRVLLRSALGLSNAELHLPGN